MSTGATGPAKPFLFFFVVGGRFPKGLWKGLVERSLKGDRWPHVPQAFPAKAKNL